MSHTNYLEETVENLASYSLKKKSDNLFEIVYVFSVFL